MNGSPRQNTILIYGASGFIGNAIYKELLPYFDVYGTYFTQDEKYQDNQVFSKYNVDTDTSYEILDAVQPNIIISCLTGDYKHQLRCHEELIAYTVTHECRLIFLSAAEVFDAKFQFPSYENDTPMAESALGRYKLSVERMLRQIPREKYTILRLPMVLGVNAPRIEYLKQAIKNKAEFEVYPNLIISTTLVGKVAQQIHYIINQKLNGIFHLTSNDVVHHADIFTEIASKLSGKMPIFKNAYRRNDDNYLALLPKENILPKPYQITVEEVIESCTLKEEIRTLNTN